MFPFLSTTITAEATVFKIIPVDLECPQNIMMQNGVVQCFSNFNVHIKHLVILFKRKF